MLAVLVDVGLYALCRICPATLSRIPLSNLFDMRALCGKLYISIHIPFRYQHMYFSLAWLFRILTYFVCFQAHAFMHWRTRVISSRASLDVTASDVHIKSEQLRNSDNRESRGRLLESTGSVHAPELAYPPSSCLHTCMHTYRRTYTHTYMNAYKMHAYNQNTHIQLYIHTYMHTYMHACIHTYIHASCMHVCVRSHLSTSYMHTYIPTHISICILT